MAFEREKQAATSGQDFDPRDRSKDVRDDELEIQVGRMGLDAVRSRQLGKKAKALEPGRTTLAEQQVAPAPRDFRREAMSDVALAMSSLARGERSGQIATGPAIAQTMMRVAEARAVTLHRHAVDDGEIDAHDPAVDASLRQVGGGGQTLPTELKSSMETEFGVSFDRVRIHTDGVAADAARAIKAEAFTVGEDIFFASGSFAPSSPNARKLIAHELAHVVQAWQGRTGGAQGRRVSGAGDALEHEADAVAHRVTQTPRARVVAPSFVPAPSGMAGRPTKQPAPPMPAPIGPIAAKSSNVQLLRSPSSAPAAAAAASSEGNAGATPTPKIGMPDVTVQRDDAAGDALRAAQAHKGEAKAAIDTLAHNMHQSTQGTTNHLHHTLQTAKDHPVGKHATGEHHRQQSEHKRHQAEMHAHAKKAQAQHHVAHHSAAHPEPNPSAHDGVDGIQFKKISDWTKMMPKPLPDQDARERSRIEKLVQKKVENERRQSAKLLGGLRAAQMKAATTVRAMKGGLQASIAGAQHAALGKVAAAQAAQAAAVQSHVAGVQASVNGHAASMKAQVIAAHAQTVNQINQGAQQATQKLTQAHAQALQQLQANEAQQHAAVTAAFAASKAQITALGAAKASQASSLPNTISLPYSGDQLSAAKKAAKKVGASYAEAMPQQASKAASQLGSHEADCQTGVTKIETQIQAKVEEAFTQSQQMVTQTRTQAIQAADKAKSSALDQIEQTAQSTISGLGAFGAQSVAGIQSQGAAASAGIAKAGAAAIAGVGSAVDKAAAGLVKGAKGLQDGAKSIEAPNVAETHKQVQKAGAELGKSTSSIAAGLKKTAGQSAGSLAAQAAGAASGMAKAAQQANAQATQMGAQANESLAKLAQGAEKSLHELGEGAKKQLDKAVEGGTKAFDACTKGQKNAYTEQLTKLKSGLDGAVKNVSDSFDKAVPTKETADILAAAKKAAASVPKHWWQKALAFVVSIVVSVIVVIAVVALIGITGGLGAILVGALAGALASVLSTMASNLVLGNSLFEGITLQSVALGAVGGAISGGLAGAIGKGVLGSTVAATMEGGEGGLDGLAGFALKTTVNSGIGEISDAGAQLIVTGHYQFSMENLVTTIGMSAVMSHETFESFNSAATDKIRTSVGMDPISTPHVDTGTPDAGGGVHVDTGGGASPSGGASHGGSEPSTGGTHAKGGGEPSGGSPTTSEPKPATGGGVAPDGSGKPAGGTTTDTGAKPGGGTDTGGGGATSTDGKTGGGTSTDGKGGTSTSTDGKGGTSTDGKPGDGATSTDGKGGTSTDGKPNDGAPANDNKPGTEGKPGDTQPAGGKPGDTQPADGKPGDTQPAGGKPGDGKPGDTQPAGGKTDTQPGDTQQPGGAKPGDSGAPSTEGKATTDETHGGGGGGGGGGEGGSATDKALEQDGYKNASPEEKAAAEAKIRSGEKPGADNLRDTEANARGLEKLEHLDETAKPGDKAKLDGDLATKLEGKPEGTGNLERDLKEVQSTEKAKAQKAGDKTEDKPPAETAPDPTSPANNGKGLSDPKIAEGLASSMKEIVKEWPSLTPEQRQGRIGEAINREAARAGLPDFEVKGVDLGPRTNGQFDFEHWGVKISKDVINDPNMTDAKMAEVTNTVLHEARHGEQWYDIARLMTAQGKDPATIFNETRIDKAAIDKAAADKRPMSPELTHQAQEWYDSVYGTNSNARYNTLTSLDPTAQAADAAYTKFEQLNSDPNATQEQRDAAWNDYLQAKGKANSTYWDYQHLPEEADAWKTGDAAQDTYNKQNAAAPDSPGFFQRLMNKFRGGRTQSANPGEGMSASAAHDPHGTIKPMSKDKVPEAETSGDRAAQPDQGGSSGNLHQGSKDLDQLYKDAAVAQTELTSMTKSIAEELGGTAIVPTNLKGRARAQEKITADYGGDPSRITDLARSSIEFDTPDQIHAAIEKIGERAQIVRTKDRFAKPADGYRDVMLNIKMENGHIVEMQLHLKSILEVKNGPGHALYEEVRTIDARAKTENRELTPAEAAERAKLVDQMKGLYDAAYEKSLQGQTPPKAVSPRSQDPLKDPTGGKDPAKPDTATEQTGPTIPSGLDKRLAKVVKDTIQRARDGKLQKSGNYHPHFDDATVMDIITGADAVYQSGGKAGRLIYRKGNDIVVVEGPGSGQGNVITGYGPSGVKGESGAAALGGAASEGGEPITHDMIVNGTIPVPKGRPPIPKAVQVAP